MKTDIEAKAKSIVDTRFEVTDVTIVPDIDDSRLTFGNTGLKFTATVLYIDMRGSTELLNKHNRTTTAKLHMIYFHTIVSIANSLGGAVRSFNGDGMLVFFQGNTKASLSTAVKAAMQMCYMLTHSDSKVRTYLEKYSAINFGIGLDHGNILCTKAGKSGSNNRDLVWLGNAVNKSVKVGDKLSDPYHVGISSYVYSNLQDHVKYHTKKDMFGYDQKVDMWQQDSHQYNGQWENYYYTSYHWTVG
ncbi:MAG: adenylate/guanylate cyclase domain-containing protein [Pseudomonadota bacterium]|nr:adenylate/guanylate cyclase domain-containing protein [Pseudomonadota bacterium]